MIHIYIRGRLGNQLFQYAFIRSLQFKKPELTVLYHFDEVYQQGSQSDGWENSLKWFKTKGVIESSLPPRFSIIQRIILFLYWEKYPHEESIDKRNRYQKKWLNLLSKFGLYYLDLGYFNFPTPDKGNFIVSGNFESEKYFSDIKDQLLTELVPIHPPKKYNERLIKIIKNTNSVCISIRRGDYIHNDKFNKLHNICNQQYFEKAINRICDLVESPTFIFFSDDIEWVREHIKVSNECYYESGDDPVWEKLRLMYLCKHFIISNSTFSWWAQYLGTYPNKVVIAPSRWYNNPLKSDLYMDNWQIIQVD